MAAILHVDLLAAHILYSSIFDSRRVHLRKPEVANLSVGIDSGRPVGRIPRLAGKSRGKIGSEITQVHALALEGKSYSCSYCIDWIGYKDNKGDRNDRRYTEG